MKKMCVFTNVFNDPYLETWIKYYLKHFTDLYVYNHGGDGNDIKELHKKYSFIDVYDPRGGIRQGVLDKDSVEYITRLQQRELLKEYEWVLYAHADEIVIPEPQKYSSIGDYIDKNNRDFVFCNGRTVLQIDEPNLDFTKPILQQRKYWWSEWAYDKPLLARVPLNWTVGYHTINEIYDTAVKYVCDNDLYLLHLQQANWPFFEQRSMWRSKDWFHHGAHEKEEIPDRFKELL